MRLLIMAASLSTLAGCSTPYFDSDLKNLTDNTVMRMEVAWPERDNHAYSPAFYNVDAKYHHWGENAIQYRWILLGAHLTRDINGHIIKTAMIPDNVPILSLGDWVDVYIPPDDKVNYNELKAPLILRLVCKNQDKACKKQSEKELGGRWEVISRGKPDLSDLIFTKKFDTEGKLLNFIK